MVNSHNRCVTDINNLWSAKFSDCFLPKMRLTLVTCPDKECVQGRQNRTQRLTHPSRSVAPLTNQCGPDYSPPWASPLEQPPLSAWILSSTSRRSHQCMPVYRSRRSWSPAQRTLRCCGTAPQRRRAPRHSSARRTRPRTRTSSRSPSACTSRRSRRENSCRRPPTHTSPLPINTRWSISDPGELHTVEPAESPTSCFHNCPMFTSSLHQAETD